MQIKLKLIKAKYDLQPIHETLLITADGKTLLNDLESFFGLGLEHDVACIGRSIMAYPHKVNYWVDVDAEAQKWTAENLDSLFPDKVNGHIVTHTLSDGSIEWFDIHWDLIDNPWSPDDVLWHGSTGLFAVLIGLEMNYDMIYLAGMPLDSNGHWYFEEEKWGPKWTGETYQAWFEFAKLPEAKKVKSLSGYTKQILE